MVVVVADVASVSGIHRPCLSEARATGAGRSPGKKRTIEDGTPRAGVYVLQSRPYVDLGPVICFTAINLRPVSCSVARNSLGCFQPGSEREAGCNWRATTRH